jgi:hypothetical protein
LALIARLIAKTDWLKSQRGLVLLDQGFLQDLWSILYMTGCAHPEPAAVAPFIRSIYDGVDAHIVFLDVKPQTAAARVGGRTHGHSRLDGLPEAELEASLTRAAQLPLRIVEAASAAGLQIVSLDGSKPNDALVAQLLPLLQSPGEKGRRRERQKST